MQPYNLEVSWSADDFAAASKALKACKEINPDNPMAVAERIFDVFALIQQARPIIEEEAERRDHALAPGKSEYYREMRDLSDQMADETRRMLKPVERSKAWPKS